MGRYASRMAVRLGPLYGAGAGWDETARNTNGASLRLPVVTCCPDWLHRPT